MSHGTLTGYTSGCRCDPCRASNTRWAKRRRVYIEEGTWAPFAPAEDARAIVAELRTAGLSAASIAHAAGLPLAVVNPLVWNFAKPREKVRIETLTALRRARRSPIVPAGAFIDGTGTRRRLEALAVQGWSLAWVASQLDVSNAFICAVRTRSRVQKRTADRIAAIYDEVSMLIGPSPEQHRRRAVKRGWAPPLAWDDETIDDPAAVPNFGDAEQGIDRDDLVMLINHGATWETLSRRLGIRRDSIARSLERAGRSDLLAILADRNQLGRESRQTARWAS